MSLNFLTRRGFLKVSALALGSLAFRPVYPRELDRDHGLLARIATTQVDVRALPNDEAPIVGNRFRDQVLHVYEQLHPKDAPEFYNTLWYRVWGGYIHSAHIQMVEIRLNEVENYVPESGVLSEITVPYSIAYQNNRYEGWIPWRGSRLYYSSVHWITGVDQGPDGNAWYQVTSELSKTEKYFVPAEHLRIIPPEEYAPISHNTPQEKKRVEVSLDEQILRAYEYNDLKLETKISSGIPNNRLPAEALPTATPKGNFVIYSKMPSKHMGSIAGGPEVEASGGFALPGVPWTSFFKSPGGYALHGAYWHNNFGIQMSHGCINMRNEDAKWLFRWTTPVFDPLNIESPADWEKTGNGTQIMITSRY